MLKNKLSVLMESLGFIQPELVIIFTIIVCLLVGLILGKKSTTLINPLSLFASIVILWLDFNQLSLELQGPIALFLNMMELSYLSIFWKVILDLGLVLSLVVQFKSSQKKFKAETIYLFFAITLGAHFLVMSSNLLMAYLSIELMSIAAYILATYGLKSENYEASIKYLLFGGVASALMIYGISMVYSFTGTLQFTEPIFIERLLEVNVVAIGTAGIMVLIGLLFKLSAVPMHIWAPDVYQTATTSIVNFFSIIPKLGGLAFTITWILAINLFGMSDINWPQVIGFIAVASLIVGNFSAVWQSNVKRMMAYSSIAQTGFLLLGLSAFSEVGLSAILFYAVIYVIMNAGAFLLIQYFEDKFNAITVDDYKGLLSQSPVLGVSFLVILISLTGLPPTAGFMAKLFVFSALWDFYQSTNQNWILFVFTFGLLNAVVSLVYYLKIPYFMIFKEPNKNKVVEYSISTNFLTIILVCILFILFFKPEWLMNMINSVNFAL